MGRQKNSEASKNGKDGTGKDKKKGTDGKRKVSGQRLKELAKALEAGQSVLVETEGAQFAALVISLGEQSTVSLELLGEKRSTYPTIYEILQSGDKKLREACVPLILRASGPSSKDHLKKLLLSCEAVIERFFHLRKLTEELEQILPGLFSLLTATALCLAEVAKDSCDTFLIDVVAFLRKMLQLNHAKDDALLDRLHKYRFTSLKELLSGLSLRLNFEDLKQERALREYLVTHATNSLSELSARSDPLTELSEPHVLVAVLKTVPLVVCDFSTHFANMQNTLIETLRTAEFSAFKDGQSGEKYLVGLLRFLTLLTKDLKQRVLPFFFREEEQLSAMFQFLLVTLYAKFEKSKAIRSEVKKCLLALCKASTSLEASIELPYIFSTLENSKIHWRSKVLAFNLLAALSKQNAGSDGALKLSLYFDKIMDYILENISHIKVEISKATCDCLDQVAKNISNPEIQGLVPYLLPAFKEPNKLEYLEKCLEELMDTTFVNVIRRADLAVVLPLLHRSLKDKNNEITRKALITIGNMCSLVANVKDLESFVPIFSPELEKLKDHSNPAIRKLADIADKALMEGIQLDESQEVPKSLSKDRHQVLEQKVVSEVQQELSLMKEEEIEPLLDPVTLQYLAHNLSTHVLRLAIRYCYPDLPTKMVGHYVHSEMNNCAGEMLQVGSRKLSIEPVQVDADGTVVGVESLFSIREKLRDSLVDVVIDAWLLVNNRVNRRSSRRHSKRYQNISAAQLMNTSGDLEEKEYLVYIPSIILAFASRLLLKRTKLAFEKGHVYGFVGQNGVGKTTMLNRISEQNILGFPKNIRVFYVRHEILVDDPTTTVTKYMTSSYLSQGAGKDAHLAASTVEKVLDEFGFTTVLKETPVPNLSGGWKMKLAIAESMVSTHDLLLLDEPTNHLDVSAVKRLTDHLLELKQKGTTVAVVSHDYDFLADICTDIVHIADQKLAYYGCGFADFQLLRPEIVAALPRAKKRSEKDGARDADGSAAGAAQGDGQNVDSVLEALSLDVNDPRYVAAVNVLKPIKFPSGSKLEGLTSRGKTVLSLDQVKFKYQNTEKLILRGISCRLNLNSRIAILGKNGAGKSTLLKLIVGMLDLRGEDYEGEVTGDESKSKSKVDAFQNGKVWKHHNLRTAYIAQHSLHHLEENLEQTPCQYIQKRFYEGMLCPVFAFELCLLMLLA